MTETTQPAALEFLGNPVEGYCDPDTGVCHLPGSTAHAADGEPHATG